MKCAAGGVKQESMYLWGRDWTRHELEERIGSSSQLGGIARFKYCDGKARGVSALRVRTAAGLEFWVLPERGLDIFEATFQGKSLCWHSPAGLSHPAYYSPLEAEWLKTFPGGLLTTCGLTTAGSPSLDLGQQLGLHGSISNTPAEHVSWDEQWENDELMLRVHGRTRESSVFGYNLVNRREIRTTLSSRSIHISDCVVNEGSEAAPFMLIYHCNFGFPFLSDRSRIYCKSKFVEGRTEFARSYIGSWHTFGLPEASIEERCYYHQIDSDDDGNSHILIIDDDRTRGLGVEMTFASASLPRFVEWKSVKPKHYVWGLEPSNCKADGRRKEREDGTLRCLGPGESARMELIIRILGEKKEIESAIVSCGGNA